MKKRLSSSRATGNESIRASVGSKIREMRRVRGLSVKELAQKCNLDPGYLSKVETNKIEPRFDKLIKLSIILGTSVTYLLSEEMSATTFEQVKSLPGILLESYTLPMLNLRGTAADIIENRHLFAFIQLPKALCCNNPKNKIFTVQESSMDAIGLHDRDWVIVNVDEPPQDGELCVICIPSGRAIIRRVKFPGNNKKVVILQSASLTPNAFPDLVYELKDIGGMFKIVVKLSFEMYA